jgi:small subunit ribosomal protein S1
VDGLIHVSDLAAGRRLDSPEELVSPGQELDVLVGQVDWENRRVSLTPLVPIPERKVETSEEGFGTTLGEAMKQRDTTTH